METASRSSRLYRNIPNCITFLRIAATAALLFISPFSKEFYAIYALAGLSDVLDGWLARRLKLSSSFGAKLDSAADLTFYTVMFIQICPVLWAVLPRVIWLGVALVVFLRLCSYAVAAIKFHRFASLHTLMNKLTGATVFALPYVVMTPIITAYCWGLFVLSLCATVEELTMHIRAKEYAGAAK